MSKKIINPLSFVKFLIETILLLIRYFYDNYALMQAKYLQKRDFTLLE